MLGSSESAWGTRVEDLPPSLGSYEGFGNFSSNSTAISRKRAVRFATTLRDALDAKTGGAYWAETGG